MARSEPGTPDLRSLPVGMVHRAVGAGPGGSGFPGLRLQTPLADVEDTRTEELRGPSSWTSKVACVGRWIRAQRAGCDFLEIRDDADGFFAPVTCSSEAGR